MDTITRLADHIQRTVDGPMWHGPALLEILKDVSPDAAAARLTPETHSIWELVLHTTAWAEIAHARLHGDARPSPAPAEDFPAPPVTTTENWKAAVARLSASYHALARAVGAMTEADLAKPVKTSGGSSSAETMIRGVVEHGTYHGGQMALLKRAQA